MDKSDSVRTPPFRSFGSALAVVLTVTTALVLTSALLAPAQGAVVRHTRTQVHTTTKAPIVVSDIRRVQGALNACRGPVAWNSRGEGAPWLMFEHDYCGGMWALSARAGDVLRIRNGVLAGTWRANGRTRTIGRGALVSTTRGLGRLVVQTCIPGTSRMRLVGFDRTA